MGEEEVRARSSQEHSGLRLIRYVMVRYHEMLFMIDTCQANTMYSRFYSPNIIATGSSEIDQSSYSHHGDYDVGVAVIDRYTYYNLDFLETQVKEPNSKLTLGDLFDSYDEVKIQSRPGIRWDLFPGGEQRGRERLIMDFFGNVQNVEVEGGNDAANETEWKEDLMRLKEIWRRGKQLENQTALATSEASSKQVLVTEPERPSQQRVGAAKVQETSGWGQRAMGAWALLGCALLWGGASWYDSSR